MIHGQILTNPATTKHLNQTRAEYHVACGMLTNAIHRPTDDGVHCATIFNVLSVSFRLRMRMLQNGRRDAADRNEFVGHP